MKILLVFPTPFETGRLGLENVVWLSEPVALTAIGAMVSGEHEVRVLDMRLEPEDALPRMLAGFDPDLVGTTSMTTDAYQAKAVLRMARRMCPRALTVVGGHMPTLSPAEFDEDYIDVIVQGEGEHTFKEIVDRWKSGERAFSGIAGTRWRDTSGTRRIEPKRSQTGDLDALPAPDRSLIGRYQGRYFFTGVRPMASIFTSRGCSFDCNFCAIWEFYERRVRYLSAKKIVDQLEACEEPFVFILDDNFLVNKKRLAELCDEIERRGVKKYWMTQGRTDFVADNPEIVRRLAACGLVGLLSGYESNDDDALAALRKKSSYDKNMRANALMREVGIFSTGIFMVRPDFTAEQFDQLYDYIRTLDIGVPLVTILTPLPGTQLYRAYQHLLMTTDHRLFDLLHAVLPTRLPRAEFYAHFARSVDETKPSSTRALMNIARARPGLVAKLLPGLAWFRARTWRYQRVHRDPATFLRDEEGLLNGPGAKLGVSWKDVAYPSAEHPEPAMLQEGRRVVPRLWADDLPAVPSLATGGAK
jgi:radical SAM superfamily enzyme YgiQ (UPF0313 family)